MPGILTLMAESAFSGPLESFVLCVFNLYYFFYIVAEKKKHWILKQNQIKPPKYPNTLTSVSVVPQLVLIFWYDQFYYSYNGDILIWTIAWKLKHQPREARTYKECCASQCSEFRDKKHYVSPSVPWRHAFFLSTLKATLPLGYFLLSSF